MFPPKKRPALTDLKLDRRLLIWAGVQVRRPARHGGRIGLMGPDGATEGRRRAAGLGRGCPPHHNIIAPQGQRERWWIGRGGGGGGRSLVVLAPHKKADSYRSHTPRVCVIITQIGLVCLGTDTCHIRDEGGVVESELVYYRRPQSSALRSDINLPKISVICVFYLHISVYTLKTTKYYILLYICYIKYIK